jgi:hypothetical protein
MADKPTVEHLWNEYARLVLPEGCHQVQEQETRRAFYAGAHSVMTALVRSLDPGEDATEDDVVRLASLMDEIEAWLTSQLGDPH